MDLELLTLDETRQLSKLIDLLGIPADLDGLGACIRVLRGAIGKYEQALQHLHDAVRVHNA